MIKIILVVAVSTLLSAIGQIFFKTASNRARPIHSKSARAYMRYFFQIIRMPRIWMGLGLMAAALALWLVAVAQGDLSLVYPIGSLYYIFVLILASSFLGEKPDKMKILGTLFIFIGIALIAHS
jgi:undecaprenyl phosphate-alpha-L-ara4N flippase subunit ArnE